VRTSWKNDHFTIKGNTSYRRKDEGRCQASSFTFFFLLIIDLTPTTNTVDLHVIRWLTAKWSSWSSNVMGGQDLLLLNKCTLLFPHWSIDFHGDNFCFISSCSLIPHLQSHAFMRLCLIKGSCGSRESVVQRLEWYELGHSQKAMVDKRI